jgi:hypothetical protein
MSDVNEKNEQQVDEKTQRLQSAIEQVIANQVRDEDPIETKQTLERLAQQGFNREQSMNLVGGVIVSEIFEVVQQGKTYDHERFISALSELPK